MDTTNKTIAVELTFDELQEIYIALSKRAIYCTEKSETMQKILAGTQTLEDLTNPDFYFNLHEFVSAIQSKIFHAWDELKKA